tara:strand:- start:1004 stop:1480 length:477 start_codon:yes stop_codon:yes gene_type:complete
MKLIITFILTLVVLSLSGQSIHHQMISSQGTSSITSSGLIVNQTVGQLSVTGNFSRSFSVQQGFQQSYWNTYLSGSIPILISTSPNPFTEIIQFNISNLKNEKIGVHIFDINGKVVYRKELFVENEFFNINLSNLSNGMYLVKLNRKDFNHFSKIIKK